jgi:branched-chain amino acid transport system substrate-binding protein
MRKSTFFRLLGVLLAVLLVGAVACTDGDDGAKETPSGTTPSATTAPDGEAPGVSATEVKLGTHTSITGPIAAYNVIPRFTLAYLNHINDTEGGVNGRTITYIQKDDQYSPAQAVDLTRQLVEQDNVFALFNALGTPNHLQVIDYLQEEGVPDMFVATGATEWVKDPTARPFVFGSNPNYQGEGLALGRWILDNMGADAQVGVIYQNDDFGLDGLAGIKIAIGDNVVGEEPYEVTAPDLNSQVDQLRSAGSDVVVMFATPLLLASGVKHARMDLGWDVQFAISAVSMNELTALIAGAENIEGTVGPVATYMAQHTDHPGIATHLEVLSGTDISGSGSVLTLYAQYVAELMVETLLRAEEPLTRASLVAAAESLEEWQCSVCLFPLTLGPDDHDPAQAVAMGVFQGGLVRITSTAYSWEGVSVADLSLDTLETIEVPADAVNAQ